MHITYALLLCRKNMKRVNGRHFIKKFFEDERWKKELQNNQASFLMEKTYVIKIQRLNSNLKCLRRCYHFENEKGH